MATLSKSNIVVDHPRAPVFGFFPVYDKGSRAIRQEDITTLDDQTKSRVLAFDADERLNWTKDGAAVLARLRALSPAVAEHYDLKDADLRRLAFRLYKVPRSSSPVGSYIALSYRWQQDRSSNEAGHVDFPTSADLFQAIDDERLPGEGLWFDQGCIDQTNPEEKSVSIPFMDLVYSRARRVVVAIQDVELTHAEVAFLEQYRADYENAALAGLGDRAYDLTGEPPAFVTREVVEHTVFREFIYKFFSSEWFQRAWCRHEFGFGVKFTFLIPCASLPTGTGQVLRFDLEFFGHLVNMYLLCVQRDSGHPLWLQRLTQVTSLSLAVKEALIRVWANILSKKTESQEVADVRHWVQHFRDREEKSLSTMLELFSLQAGGDPLLEPGLRPLDANVDKISIALNMLGYGLKVQRQPETLSLFTENECYRHMNLLSLAALESAALCTKGPPLLSPSGKPSWLCRPFRFHEASGSSSEDWWLHQPSPTTPISVGSDSKGFEYIQTSLAFLPPSRCILPRFYHRALRLLRLSFAYGILWGTDDDDSDPPSSATVDRRTSMQADILSCLFSCGLDFIVAASAIPLMPDRVKLTRNQLDSLLRQDCTVREDAFHADQDVRTISGNLLEFIQTILQSEIASTSGKRAYSWIPKVFCLSHGQSLITFVPPLSDIAVAVPSSIKDRQHEVLSRCWVLTRRQGVDSPEGWSLLGKSTMLHDPAALVAVETLADSPEETVYGISHDEFVSLSSEWFMLWYHENYRANDLKFGYRTFDTPQHVVDNELVESIWQKADDD